MLIGPAVPQFLALVFGEVVGAFELDADIAAITGIQYDLHQPVVVQVEFGPADVNAGALIDRDGFGGHTALFHTTVTLGPKTAELGELLLSNGANPDHRATIRKQLRYMGEPEKEQMREFQDVTAIEFGCRTA